MAILPKVRSADVDALDASPLCLDCGLCCNGAIHHYGVLKENEVEAAERLGLAVERTRDYLGFAQPCTKHDGNQCTIYELRPSTCVNYYCGLASRYRKGEIPLRDALQVVAEARRLYQSVAAALPTSWTFRDLRLKLRRRMTGDAAGDLRPEERETLKDPFLKAMLLDVFLDRNFRLTREVVFGDKLAKTATEQDNGN